MRDRQILKLLLYIGCGFLPFLFRKQPIKDWIFIFCIKAFYSGFIDSFVVAQKHISYPVRFFPKVFKINILFDLLLFPIVCVLYNQITYRTNLIKTALIAFIFSIPITLVEIWAERNTRLIRYEKSWNWIFSFITLTCTFWLVRATLYLVRLADKTTIEQYEAKEN
ncbi:CBO0543 family protein [Bacillus sp. S/N-304-OC-R1]|uniref:CBO0543 family protein n=1 Tax=Bacillus sp. S/N-304-OC-R1 TaxID=2758034 RepID=UPI001C8D0282|nr:CBO0543 family protein [Bacillus sp. S/N-304-OC-R1]MBY0122002.1 hypothetical protein [Bacillus sp. S/N-304-OC-R1]